MKIKALVPFSGAISMGKGQVMEYDDEVILQDLLQAGYIQIQEVKTEKSKKDVKSNESKRNTKK